MSGYEINGTNITSYMIETTTNDSNGIRTYYTSFPYTTATTTAAERMLTTGYKIKGVDISTLDLAATKDTSPYQTSVPTWCNRICAIGVGGGGGGGQGGANSGAANGGNAGRGGFGAIDYTPVSGTAVTPGAPLVVTVGNGGAGAAGTQSVAGNASNVVVNGTNILSAAGGNRGINGNSASGGVNNGNTGASGTPTSAGTMPASYPTELSPYGIGGAGGGGGSKNGTAGGDGQVYLWYKYAI